MDTEKRMHLIMRRPTEEILTHQDLQRYLETGIPLKHYIGFEISGRMHLGTGFGCMLKVADLLEAGVECTVFLADYHSWINNKLGGDRDLINKFSEYFKRGFQAVLRRLGADPSRVRFITGSELYHHNDDYWKTVLEVSQNITLSRAKRSITIMGREEGDNVNFAQLIYPSMQVADIFALGVNIAHAGMDQRKAHVVARDVALKLKTLPFTIDGKKEKPLALHHHLWLGLHKPPVWPIPPEASRQDVWSSMKMSKSKPDTAVFIDDEPEAIRKKLRKAFCPEKEVEFNPVIDWVRSLIMREDNTPWTIPRPEKWGGNIEVTGLADLEEKFRRGEVHPADLKNAVAEYLVELLEPVRKEISSHFDLEELWRSLKITR